MTTAASNFDLTDIENALPVAWRPKWGHYLIEAASLGAFMVSAVLSVYLLEHPASPLHGLIVSGFARRSLVGIAMGLTAIALIYNPLGKRSGALMNPAMTLGFLCLGKIDARDAAGYMAAQFIGAAAGMALMKVLAMDWVMHPSVGYVATVPGSAGVLAAWIAEFAISFFLVVTVLSVNKVPALAPFTGCFAAVLVAVYITFEAPISGMSMNPARTFGSALLGHVWTGWWIYLTAPVLGMLSAAELLAWVTNQPHRLCGRLSHGRQGHFKCTCLQTNTKESS